MPEETTEDYIQDYINHIIDQKQKTADMLSVQIEHIGEIENFQNFLRGGRKLNNAWVYDCEPIMNEEGISGISRFYEIINKSTILSRIENENDKKDFMKHFANKLYDSVVANHRHWEIAIRMMEVVCEPIINSVEMNVNRAIGMRTASLLNKNIQHIESEQWVHQLKGKKGKEQNNLI